MQEDVPLVVPEVNRHDIFKHKGIIANPNCSTIQLVVALKPLDEVYRIKRVIVSTYQSVSGIGNKGVTQLHKEIHDEHEPINQLVFPYKIAYNAIPHIDIFMEDGYTREEYKMIHETRKIMHRHDLKITTTCVRVPTIGGHCESVNIEFEKHFNIHDVREILSKAKSVVVFDDVDKLRYPMPIYSHERDEVFVGRIREDESFPKRVKHVDCIR